MCVSMLCQRTIPGLVQASASPMKLCFHLFVQSLCQGWQATKKVILLIFFTRLSSVYGHARAAATSATSQGHCDLGE